MHHVLASLAEQVVRTRVDLVHFPILFYFYVEDPRASVAHALRPLQRFAEEGQDPGRDDLVRFAASSLQHALIDLAEKIGERLELKDKSPHAAFRAFSELHGPEPSDLRNRAAKP